MEMFMIKQFFLEVLELSYTDLKPGWGNPCSELLKKLVVRQEPFLKKIEGDYTDMSHEMRINGAGLKMHWSVDRREGDGKFKITISGDQAKEYPVFVPQVRQLIKKYGFNKY